MAPWTGWSTGWKDSAARWIWNTPGAASDAPINVPVYFTKRYRNENADNPKAAILYIIADDIVAEVYVNNVKVELSKGTQAWGPLVKTFVLSFPTRIMSTLTIVAKNSGGPAGLLASVTDVNGNVMFSSGSSWIASAMRGLPLYRIKPLNAPSLCIGPSATVTVGGSTSKRLVQRACSGSIQKWLPR